MANEQQRQMWSSERFVGIWKRVNPTFENVTAPLFEALAPQPGEQILDVGCGGGLTTLQLAQLTSPGGSVTGIDISEPLLAIASERAAAAALDNIRFVCADAQEANIAGGPFDAATSRLGVMFFSDPPAAFANIRRHLRPGGRLVFICFQPESANPWYPAQILAKYAPPPPDSPFPPLTQFALSEERFTRHVLETAGFEGITLTPCDAPADEDPVSEELVAGLVARLSISDETRPTAIAELLAHYQSNTTDGRDRSQRHYWLVQARNP